MLFPGFIVKSCLSVLLFAALTLFATHAQAEGVSPEKAQEYMKLNNEIAAAWGAQDKDWAKIIQLCQKQLELAPNAPDPHYNLACALARQGKKDEALAELAKSVAAGWYDAKHMREDDDLETLRKEKQFEELAAKTEANAKSLEDKLYDKGAEIPGVKTVEGNPQGGLRWRLRMSPNASALAPNRLIVWLHPSGGSMNKQAEAFSAEFNKRGFALLVPTMKQWVSWSAPELQALMNITVTDAAKTPGIEPHKPILMGFSAGGQGALLIYEQNAKNLGGLILDAAYPMDPGKQAQRQVALWSLPQGEEKLAPFKKVPLFVLVGEQDGGAQLWKAAQKQWGEQGVPLTLTVVPGQKHAWLFGKSQTEALYTWLEQVAKGELPGATKDEKAQK